MREVVEGSPVTGDMKHCGAQELRQH